jgi:hypothetical protein
MPWPRASDKQFAEPAPQLLVINFSALALKFSCIQKIRAPARIHDVLLCCLVTLHQEPGETHIHWVLQPVSSAISTEEASDNFAMRHTCTDGDVVKLSMASAMASYRRLPSMQTRSSHR